MRTDGMDQLIELLRPVFTRSDYGGQVVTYESAGTFHAERVKLSGRMRTEVAERFSDYSAEFNVHYAVKAGDGWRLRHVNGYLYTITNIIPNRKAGMNTLVCERVNE